MSIKLRLQAIADLLRRYGGAFGHAWTRRAELDHVPRQPHEAQFLPAALALQETPVSPAPRVAMWLLIAFAALVVGWAIWGRIEVVAVAHGKIVPNDRVKTIQPMETATVTAIRVADGQQVTVGDVLIELDATSTSADSARLSNDQVTAQLQGVRAKAILAAIASGQAPALGEVAGVASERLIKEQRILEGQYDEYRARLAQLDADIACRQAELQSTTEIVRKLEQTAPIAAQRAQDFKELVAKDFASRYDYLEKEEARIDQEADLATQRSRLQEINAALHEVESQRNVAIAEMRRMALDSLNEAEQRATTSTQELVKAESRGQSMTLTAPVSGTVQQLAVHTIGGVVTPAQPLMVIVPMDNALEVEAFLENKDIGFVNPGQESEIKIETFPFTKYGTIHAKVIHVSHDAINDEKRGLVYAARVRLSRSTMQVEDKTTNLSAGMAVTVEIKTSQRRVIEYFLSPLLRYANESLRER